MRMRIASTCTGLMPLQTARMFSLSNALLCLHMTTWCLCPRTAELHLLLMTCAPTDVDKVAKRLTRQHIAAQRPISWRQSRDCGLQSRPWCAAKLLWASGLTAKIGKPALPHLRMLRSTRTACPF